MRKEIIFISGRSTVAPPAITNYVFDGSLNSYLTELSATMLDGIVNQTWVIRVKRTVNGHQHGILGTENSTRGLKLEVDFDDDKIDVELNDVGASTFTNAVVPIDGAWYNYFFYYDGTDIGLYENNTLIKVTTDPGFTGRTPGRIFALGASIIGNGAPTEGRLIGEISDVQFYNRRLTIQEINDLNTNLSNTATGLIANFAGNKTATEWTSEIGGYVLTNKGGVTTS